MALINLRNALMAGKRLPYDAEVEYLSTPEAGSYIDLGLNSTADKFYNFEISFALLYASSTIPFGYLYGATARYGLWNDAVNWYVGANNSNSIDLGAKDTDWHHVLTNFGTSVEVDGNTLAIGGGSVRANIGLNLFARVQSSSGATSRALSRAKISMFRIWDTGGNLLRDFIPVRKGTVGYLYDRVSGKLFGNAGTGDFVLGPDVVPVEYIESHGTEWIDTGVPAQNITSNISVFFNKSNMTTPSGVFGCRSASDQRYQIVDSIGIGDGYYFGTLWPRFYTWVNFEMNTSGSAKIDGMPITATSGTFTSVNSANTVYLFAINRAGYNTDILSSNARISDCKIFQNSALVRSFLPVRVGTDATSWEGAMMDVLTRRIYRNAGTGAFTYGNDLKYPIPSE